MMSTKMFKKLACGAAAVALLGGTAAQAAMAPAPLLSGARPSFVAMVNDEVGQGAQDFIDRVGAQGIEFLSDENLSVDQKADKFRRLLAKSFDMDTIGRFSLGRYWRQATPAQQREYQKLFKAMVIDVYAARFDEYSGQSFETEGNRYDGKKDTIVQSVLKQEGNGADIRIDWRVRYKNGSYKIVDVIVEGVSMSLTQRSDFASVIQRGGGDIEVLLDHLRG